MTLIEIRPHRRGLKVFEADIEPVFQDKDHAIDYAQNCANFGWLRGNSRSRFGAATSSAQFRLTTRIESCDAKTTYEQALRQTRNALRNRGFESHPFRHS
jgi:hypothetical protein